DKTLNNFHQYVDCPTRDNKTLDLLYANAMDAYDATALPPWQVRPQLSHDDSQGLAGDREEQRRVQHELRDMLRTCKDNYRRKLEAKLQWPFSTSTYSARLDSTLGLYAFPLRVST
ncbi:hypothetical protein L3Q82_012194, partial [Scortum barcoo]